METIRLINIENREDKIELFSAIGYNAKATDLAITLGGQIDDNNYSSYFTMNDSDIYERMEPKDYRVPLNPSYYNSLDEDAAYRRMTPSEMADYEDREIETSSVLIIEPERQVGRLHTSVSDLEDFTPGIRPVIDTKRSNNPIWQTAKENEKGVLEVYYGEYPTSAVDTKKQQELEEMYTNNALSKTDKTYTFYTNSDLDNSLEYEETKHQEYTTPDGKKYIRINYQNIEDYTLNGTDYAANTNKPVWIEVQPVKWFIDKNTGLAITENVLSAGCPFLINQKAYNGDFDATMLSNALYQMSKDLVVTKTKANGIFIDSDAVEEIKTNYQEKHSQTKSK